MTWKAAALAAAVVISAAQQAPPRLPLAEPDISAIARLLMLEDTRQLDLPALTAIAASKHPEVRRRAAIAIGRIAKREGGALLAQMRDDVDPAVRAAVVFATGQLKDPTSIPWLAHTMAAAGGGPSAQEAAVALGKFAVPEARPALAAFLSTAPQSDRNAAVVGSALLSIGRFPAGGDIAPVLRWTQSRNVETRWRAAWALFRPRDAAAFPELLRLSRDPSGDVRFWATRGLTPPSAAAVNAPASAAPAASFPRDAASARLREALTDPDRRVRTEALRALAQFDDDLSFAAVLAALDSPDSWLSVSAAEALGRYTSRANAVAPRLVAATAAGRPLALRITALAPLAALAPQSALEPAAVLGRESSVVARQAARQVLGRLGEAGKTQLDRLAAERPPAPGASAAPVSAAPRTEADYRRLVERWIVPAYNGEPAPRARWDTPRGIIELELYPADAPLGTDYFVKAVESGTIVGTEFGRVVPNFVAQQRAIQDSVTLRDEVSQRGLTRGNLSWASAGLDTGRPGYTLGITPQPHNEGNFTALGRVVAGMDVVERLELGDAITGARILPTGRQ